MVPNIPENLVQFCCVFWKLDHLACNRILVSRKWFLKRAVILKIYYMPNGLTSLIHEKHPPNFQGCWGKMEGRLGYRNLKDGRLGYRKEGREARLQERRKDIERKEGGRL